MEMHGCWNNKEERDNDPGYQRAKALKKKAGAGYKKGVTKGDVVAVKKEHLKHRIGRSMSDAMSSGLKGKSHFS